MLPFMSSFPGNGIDDGIVAGAAIAAAGGASSPLALIQIIGTDNKKKILKLSERINPIIS
ncbi:hypothetical protein DPMN_040399 [Dreissena polymorpha]|uniref:Uncharacterized protein n=1 Tax=Dreissena polymorpha TaxID=45954 RepID=A0A9D4HT11_DREPO|nr:hypothetical protein DPMN_040399 [Dreissena polymorpha]